MRLNSSADPGAPTPGHLPRRPGASIRVDQGFYHRPTSSHSRPTFRRKRPTKHIYSSGPKKFRVRYDKIVDFEPYDDGFGIMKDNQTAKPQVFRTGDGWFSYNLAVNLAQM